MSIVLSLSQYVWNTSTKVPQARGLINNRNLFLRVMEAGKSKIKVPEDLLSKEPAS